MRENWRLCELLSLQELGEGSAARVLSVDLLNIDGAVRQEEVEVVELVTTVVGKVLPQDLEAKDTAIVIQELLETTVRATTLQLNLDVVFELSLIGRGLLHVDHGASEREGVSRVVLGLTDIGALVGEVAAREFITVHDAEHAAVDVEVHTEAEITPVVVTRAIGLDQLGTLQENALRDTRVGHTRLKDVESIIIEVEVDEALSDAVVLGRVLDDRLEEVCLEIEHLNIQISIV